VLNVVRAGQLPVRERVMDKQERQHEQAKCNDESDGKSSRKCVRLQDQIAWMPDGHIATSQPVFLDSPGFAEGAWYFTDREAVNALAHA